LFERFIFDQQFSFCFSFANKTGLMMTSKLFTQFEVHHRSHTITEYCTRIEDDDDFKLYRSAFRRNRLVLLLAFILWIIFILNVRKSR
jgi:hypothetical protein